MFEKFSKNKALILLVIIGLYLVLYFAFTYIPDQRFHIYFLDIGQGDSIFIKTPQNHQILIDGGPKNKILEELAGVISPFDKSIDMMILTHPHADHIDGLVEVLKRYKVENVLLTGVNFDNPTYMEFLKEIKEQKINFFIAEEETDFKFDEVLLDVIYPEQQLLGHSFDNLNNSSIALKLVYHNKSILLTGDLEKEIEEKLLNKGIPLKTDIYKAGHHGSKTSSTLKFIQKVRPDYVIIQSGKNNKFGHPHKETLENLEINGVKKIYRNDLNGRIEIVIH